MSNRPKSIALVDISYLFKKRWVTHDGSPMGAAKSVLRDLESLRHGVEHVIICRDAPPYKRAEVYPDYKANRPEQEPEERLQRKHLWLELKRQGFSVASSPGAEADDVMATLAFAYSQWCSDVRLVGPDKDMAQCVCERVVQYIPPQGDKDWIVRNEAGVVAKFGVIPLHMPFLQALIGDKSDNVPGVPGLGPVKGPQLVTKYKSIVHLAEALAVPESSIPPGIAKALTDHWAQLKLSLDLVTLDKNVAGLDAEALLVRAEPEPEEPAQNAMDNEPANDPEPEVEVESKPADWAAKPEQMARRVRSPQVLTTTHAKYGIVTDKLQPLDLTSAYAISEWLHRGHLFPQYKNEAQVFTIIARGKELGIGMIAALSGHHIIDGKPVTQADLIRALAERDPNYEYLMPIEMSAQKVTWRGKNRSHPSHVDYTYTIEDAKQAGLVRASNYGKPSNWQTRPQDMLVKTAGTKLARLLWPSATFGLYCPEEMGYSHEELESREAA